MLFDSPNVKAVRERPVILLADDSLTIRTMVSSRLERAGYDIELAADGAEALELAKRLDPDLFILDVEMPGLTGLEVTAHLRQAGVSSPVILLTGMDDETDVAAGLAAGANEYITKPFSPQDLYLLVSSLVSSPAETRALR